MLRVDTSSRKVVVAASFDTSFDTISNLTHTSLLPSFVAVCVHGPSGSGKSAIADVFVREFYTNNVEDGRITMKDCVYRTTGEKVSQSVRKFVKAVEHWKKRLDHQVKKHQVQPALKCVLVDCLDQVPSHGQQTVRQLIEAMDSEGVRFVFTCDSPKKLIKEICAHSYLLPMKRLPQADMLKIALGLCLKEVRGAARSEAYDAPCEGEKSSEYCTQVARSEARRQCASNSSLATTTSARATELF